jgi:transcriptional regulator with XRE-family HTH domain
MGTSILKELRERKGWTQPQAADAMGISKGGYIKLERGERELKKNTIEAAAKAFGVPRTVIMQDLLRSVQPVDQSESHLPEKRPGLLDMPGGELHETNPGFVMASHGGIVEAGAFRPVDEFGDEEPRPRALPRDPDYPWAEVATFDVGGDSMNALKPRPIMAGDQLVCLKFESLKGRVPIRDGMVVVVEQARDGGHLRERSVKQVEIYEDRVEFHPRSTNPKHKPIVIPWKMFTGEEQEDGRKVEILAIVRSIFNSLPLS